MFDCWLGMNLLLFQHSHSGFEFHLYLCMMFIKLMFYGEVVSDCQYTHPLNVSPAKLLDGF